MTFGAFATIHRLNIDDLRVNVADRLAIEFVACQYLYSTTSGAT